MVMALRQLLAGFAGIRISGDPEARISSICVDSRRVDRGALFVCLRGERDDGHAHAAAALRAGAAAVLAQRTVDVPAAATVALVPDTLAALSPLAARLYGRPSSALTCIGVTGTNGKTTTTHFLEAIMKADGRPYGLVGTLGARLGEQLVFDLEHTTPYAHELQRLLAAFREAGAAGAIMEVSSHALALHRVDDVDFDVAVLTNVTQDHLDFHGTFDEYRATKRRLFERAAGGTHKGAGVCVLNVDDAEGRRIAESAPRRATFGIENENAIYRATDVRCGIEGSTFLVKALRPAPFAVRLPGAFNAVNALAAIAAAAALDIDVEAIAGGIEAVREVPGRMTRVPAGDVGVYVDYAHTPDGLRQVLGAARALGKARLICVFGCGGDRDALKRPVMGRAARELADHVIVTSDNPRFEDPARIIGDILAGMRGVQGATYEVVPDRAEAIERAVALARAGDVVVIAGKGHEPYQLVRGEHIPFSDAAVAQRAIRKVRA